jgi:malic enzyme
VGALYPSVSALREVSRTIAIRVATQLRNLSGASASDVEAVAHDVDESMWWPEYVPYRPA